MPALWYAAHIPPGPEVVATWNPLTSALQDLDVCALTADLLKQDCADLDTTTNALRSWATTHLNEMRGMIQSQAIIDDARRSIAELKCDPDSDNWRRYQQQHCPAAVPAAVECDHGVQVTTLAPRNGSMAEFLSIAATGFASVDNFLALSKYWHHFCVPAQKHPKLMIFHFLPKKSF